jgi:2-aminoadipate transaminase
VEEEVAKTLGELERKLGELESTLAAIGRGEAPQPDPVPAPLPTSISPSPGPSRLVDETIENARPAPPPAAGNGPLGAGTPTPPSPSRVPSSYSTPPPYASGMPHSAPVPQQATPPRPLQPPAARAGGAAARPSNATGGQSLPPSASELLHFRERLEQTTRELTHDYDELLGRLSYPAMPAGSGPTISFARGVPSLDIIDVEGLRDAAVRAFDSDPGGTTAYGTSVGYPRLRAWIADRHGVEPERVFVTNGSLQADAFLFDQLVHPGDDVVVESPTYDRTLLGLRERGARLHAVQLQPDGIDTDSLGRLLDSGVRPKLAHIIPNFQNPAGYTLSLAKRHTLLAQAAEHGFFVLEDDPYGELRFSGEPMPTMVSLDPDRVVYASSFTKTVCPGVRVGYLVGPREVIDAVIAAATNTYISPNMVSEAIVYEFCASGAIERSIETVRTALAQRAATLGDSLRSQLPDAVFVPPQGGYFMWVTLPEGTDVHALFDAAAERGVAFVKGTDFLLEGGENTLRLAYSGVTPAEIEEGVSRLAAAYRSL